jgi:hypothetical protein
MATRRSSRTLRFWAICGIMPLSELRTFHPKVHRPPTSLSRGDSLRQRLNNVRAQWRDSETLPIWFLKGRNRLFRCRSVGHKTIKGWQALQSSSLPQTPREEPPSRRRPKLATYFFEHAEKKSIFKRLSEGMYGHAGGFKQHRNRSKKPKSARYYSSDANMTTIEMMSSV